MAIIKTPSLACTKIDAVKQQIFIARGQRVMLDSGPCKLYGVTTKQLKLQHVFNAIRALIELPRQSQRPIGFIAAFNKRKTEHQCE